MANPNLDINFASTVLAALRTTTSDASLCKRYGISLRTLQRYKKLEREVPELARAVAAKLKVVAPKWQQELNMAMIKVISVVVDQAEQLRNDPKELSKTVNALQALGELAISNQVLFEDSEDVRPEEIEEIKEVQMI